MEQTKIQSTGFTTVGCRRFTDEENLRLEEFFSRNRQWKRGDFAHDAMIEKLDREEHIERIRSGEAETQYTGPITEEIVEDA